MDQDLLDLLALSGDELTAHLATLTDEELADINTRLLASFDATRDADVADLDLLRSITEHVEELRLEDDRRQTAAEEAATEIAALADRVHGTASDATDDGDEDASTDDGDDATEDGDTDEATAAGDAEVEDAPAEGREAVAAAATARPARTSLRELNARRPAAAAPAADDPRIAQVITAGAHVRTSAAGAQFGSMDDVAAAVRDTARSVIGMDLAPGQKFSIARISTPYPEERQLSPSDADLNDQRIQAVVASARAGAAARDASVVGAEALVAAGGLCAPLDVRYELNTVGDDYRPVRDALMRFDGSRGGVRFMSSPVLSDIDIDGTDAAISQWTNDQDVAALTDTGVRKPIARIICGSEVTVETYAVVQRVLVGNILARTNPERVRAFLDLVGVAHSRYAEQLLLARIKTLSTTTLEENEPILGSTRDFKQALVKAAWATRSRNRMTENDPLRTIVPDALAAHVAIDLARELPGAPTERLTVQARQMLRDIGNEEGVTITFSPDVPNHVAGAQAADTKLLDLPSPIEWVIFPEGTFGYVDGGELDLGFAAGTPIRDNASNAMNDFQLFGESWENVAKFGGAESLWNKSYLCPTGTTSGTDVVDCSESS